MKARLIKETRNLLPVWAGTLLLIVVPYAIWQRQAEEFGYVALALGCAIMAGCSFGNEFAQRTLSLLLSQPIARAALWREKMLVLGVGMAMATVVLWACLKLTCGPALAEPGLAALLLIPFCVFCGAPYLTLLTRNAVAGVVLSFGPPAGILVGAAGVSEWMFKSETVGERAAVCGLIVYGVLVYSLGYIKFKRLEVVNGPLQTPLGLPASLETLVVRRVGRVFSGWTGPLASLLKKELRLQLVTFVTAGLLGVVAVAGAGLYWRNHNLGESLLGMDCVLLLTILPLLAGAISVAEERAWEVADWQLTLPPSALKQWSAKMVVALSTSLIFGLLLPLVMLLAGQRLFASPGADAQVPPAYVMLAFLPAHLLVTSLAVYAATFSNNTLRAILWAFAMILALLCWIPFAVSIVVSAAGFLRRTGLWGSSPPMQEGLEWLVAGAELFALLCLVQGFAYSNYRQRGLPVRRFVVQGLVVLLLAGFLAFVVAAVCVFNFLLRHS